MSLTLRKPMSREAFFDWAEAQEERYEFDGEQPVLMTGGSLGHSRLIGRLLAMLLAQLEGSSFESLGPDAGVPTVGGDRVRYPDAVIAMTRGSSSDRLVSEAVIVFEIVSPSSTRMDRIIKLREYGQVDSIRSYIILEIDEAEATVFHKHTDGSWLAAALTANDAISLPACGIHFTLAALHGRVPDAASGS